jgi:hypothetical protein
MSVTVEVTVDAIEIIIIIGISVIDNVDFSRIDAIVIMIAINIGIIVIIVSIVVFISASSSLLTSIYSF